MDLRSSLGLKSGEDLAIIRLGGVHFSRFSGWNLYANWPIGRHEFS